ncbi:GENERAL TRANSCRIPTION FACTOR 3C POLYPEPTIDE 1 [Plasmopara halstedii]|uniref:GENERAL TRANSCRIPTION FACTOR 3C POLYPEPTIDE 1 n=1 Tax=Plasmopara halstedii TaxID=4781 RepID=A0A0P1B984_PLAHL|nr:GENERAL TRANSCRIPTION FACTOR 3C POLYPEPTIDE 1 [Plasmopara halstedii]CEG50442.1 GENERAL TRANSCRIPTION FACTOR 3C POLYPEPTIDE 1 [Plasmopara halstedii]|eukprot:XP_024586811.1 GENERAL TRANSCRIPTION FACTOR 3C POLYPEPTIDE 1 [Plasmopara halstedii]
MYSARGPRELVAACMDQISLEGSAGLTVTSLFSSLEPSNDVFLHQQVWRLLRSSRGVLRFFRRAILSPNKKRKRPGTTESYEVSVDMKGEMHGPEIHGPNDILMLTTEELELLTYEEAVAMQQEVGTEIVVIACEELRHRALNIPLKAIAADLGPEHFGILEAVGRARIQGVTINKLTYILKAKRMMIVTRPTMRRLNIIHLPRFADKFQPQMFDESASFEFDEQSRKILCVAAETYLKGLPTYSSVLSDLGRDLCLQKRHLEVLRSHITQECKADENFSLELFQAVLQPSQRGKIEPKILNCVRYKPPNTCKNAAYCRGIVLELGLLHQIYRVIEANSEIGTTIIDLRNQIVLPGSKLPYKLVGILAGMYSLKAESIILGKNKAFRLYLDSTAPSAKNMYSKNQKKGTFDDTCLPQESRFIVTTNEDEVATDVIMERQSTPRVKMALKVALRGLEVDGTNARRRQHILDRLNDEKIISLSSLRESVFGMEKQRAETNILPHFTDVKDEISTHSNANSLMLPTTVGKVDTRSIFRIATELEGAKKLRLLQLPLPAQNVSTKFRALRCVVAPGYENKDAFIQRYVKNYCRDERLRRINRKADQSKVIRFDKIGDEQDEKPKHKFARKRLRKEFTLAASSSGENKKQKSNLDGEIDAQTQLGGQVSDIEAALRTPASYAQNEVSYRIRCFVSQQKSGIHYQQFRKLGFAYGVMYRCKALHRFLWDALHRSDVNFQLPGEEKDTTIKSLNEVNGDCRSRAAPHQAPLPGIVFSRESILHSMPVHLYIQIFSGGGVLTDAEFAIVEEAVKHQRTFEAIPKKLCKKIWCHESQRTAKVLGTLADLGLIQPHKIGMKHLVEILRAGYTDGRDGVLSRALKDNALGGLFRFNKQVRIRLNDHDNTCSDIQTTNECRDVNDLDSIRIVGFTEKTYSFASTLPLTFSFQSSCDVDRFWEALECLCLEQMTMEVETPRRNEPAVREVPKPVKTRARRMLRILAWIPKSQKPVAKQKRDEGSHGDNFKSSGIVSTISRPRKKRRHAECGGENNNLHNGAKRKHRKKYPAIMEDGQSKVESITWLDVHEQLLDKYFIDNCKSRWKVPIPQGLQRDNERVAFRNHTVSRTGFGLVTIARKLGKRRIDVKRRLKERLMEPTVKVAYENAKLEAKLADNPSGLFDEEIAIQETSRMTALFRRAVMMIMSPREDYHPLVAEELISSWSSQEIRLVWRYLWLKNWIVRAPEKERGRGYSTSKRLQDILKVNTLSYPLLLFQQAAEQESLVCSTLEEIDVDSKDAKISSMFCVDPQYSDQLFENDFPTNATPGQCALELGCQVLGTCSFTAVHVSASDINTKFEDLMAITQTIRMRAPTPGACNRDNSFTCTTLKGRAGFAAHLANKVNVSKASDFIDSWRVETKMHAVSVEDTDLLSANEAFSLEEICDNARFHQFQYAERVDEELSHAVAVHVRESGEEGLTMLSLVIKCRKPKCTENERSLRIRVARCLDALVEQGQLIVVNAYFEQRYIVKEHGDVWMLRPYLLISGTSPRPKLLFEEGKNTLSFPWLKMDGGTNYTFLFSIQRKLLALIIQAPGISEKCAYFKMNKLLSLQDTREAMSMLAENGLVYARAVTNSTSTQVASLFGCSVSQPSVHKIFKLEDNVLSYDRSVFQVRYFPHVECIQRFGSIVQDYQNIVFQND